MLSPTPTQVGFGEPVDPLADPLLGHVLDSKYQIRSVLGSGGMSLVYEGEHLGIGRRVAIKVLHRHCAMHRELVERFEREARAAARINHPNIVDVLDFGRLGNGIPYIVMELLAGQGLFDRLASGGAMPGARAIEIVLEVLAALDAAHRAGVFHRDIKPENIFLARGPDGSEVVKVVDFGIAKFADLGPDGPRLTTEGLAMGTPAYMPPEQATGSADIDARSDLYSVGVLLYELLSHRLPHEGTLDATITKLLTQEPTPLREFAPWVPEPLAEVVHKAISRSREDRFQTAGALSTALQPFVSLPPIEVGPIPLFRRNSEPAKTLEAGLIQVADFPAAPKPWAPPEPAQPPRRRKAPTIGVALVALVAMLGLGLLGILLPSAPGREASARAGAHRRPGSAAPHHEARAVRPASVPVLVSTNVAGAVVSLDGRPLGATPLDTSVPTSSAAQHLRIVADGYQPAEYWVRTSSPVRVTVTLEPVQSVAPAADASPARPVRKNAGPRLPFNRAY